MAECMMFPNDWEKFLNDYSFVDDKEVYTNGSRLIPAFRVEQMMEHYLQKAQAENTSTWIPVTEMMPERFVEVLLWDAIDGTTFMGELDGDDEWYIAGFQDETFDITHWMPLPAVLRRGPNG